MPRVSENSITLRMLNDMLRNREQVNKYSSEISSGLKVVNPGDSKHAGTIASMQETLIKIQEDELRVSNVMGFVSHQDSALDQVNEILTRATEIAAQASNESNSENERFALAAEVWEIREHLVGLANTQYQGRYIFSGASDASPAYSIDTGNPFTIPATTSAANDYYRYDTGFGADESRDVQVTTDLEVTINKPADQIFQNAIEGLTELGRALEGYRTVYDNSGALPVPDNALSTAYVFPTDFQAQSTDIRAAMDKIEKARAEEIIPERTNVAGKLRRLETASSLLELSKTSAENVLNDFQAADVIESASFLTEAQTALNASLQITTRLLGQSILDYL